MEREKGERRKNKRRVVAPEAREQKFNERKRDRRKVYATMHTQQRRSRAPFVISRPFFRRVLLPLRFCHQSFLWLPLLLLLKSKKKRKKEENREEKTQHWSEHFSTAIFLLFFFSTLFLHLSLSPSRTLCIISFQHTPSASCHSFLEIRFHSHTDHKPIQHTMTVFWKVILTLLVCIVIGK